MSSDHRKSDEVKVQTVIDELYSDGVKPPVQPTREVRPSRFIVAILVCAGVLFAYACAAVAIGWRRGGGIIPMILLMSLVAGLFR